MMPEGLDEVGRRGHTGAEAALGRLESEAPMLRPEDRGELRDRAVAAWSAATTVRQASSGLQSRSREIRGEAQTLRTVARSLRGDDVDRVNRILDVQAHAGEVTAYGVGLVTAGRLQHVGELHHALHQRLPQVLSARDPAVAVGLAIVTQPDVALVADDEALPAMSGLDAAFLIQQCAPNASVMLFTSDREADARARHAGIATSEPLFSTGELQSLVDELVPL
jgi:hypothetical protein